MPVDSFKADSLAFLCLATIYIPATIYYFVKHILLHPWHSQAMCSSRLESIHSQRQNPSSGDTADRSVSTQFWQQLPPSPLLHGVFKLLLFLACVSSYFQVLFFRLFFHLVFTFSPLFFSGKKECRRGKIFQVGVGDMAKIYYFCLKKITILSRFFFMLVLLFRKLSAKLISLFK